VFTPFWRTCQAKGPEPKPEAAPKKLDAPSKWPRSLRLDELELLPRGRWDRGFYDTWRPGALGAEERLTQFCINGLASYKSDRNRLDVDGFSRLSPHLHWGELSPRQVVAAVRNARDDDAKSGFSASAEALLAELGWREFAHHQLYHFPHTVEQPLREAFRRFPWRRNATYLKSWQRGQTGYPIVDAAMRQLWATGFMPNRARMIVGSFLVKDLRIQWQEGAEWFWDTLVDADLANNSLNWQWIAGCGADAAPYFRVFNPVRQAEQFDPKGDYIRRWVPELAGLPTPWIFNPWAAPNNVLADVRVRLGKTYPRPIVDHAQAREAALAAFARIRGS
jgi:deoxyribodipyrimidine photo-lyase